MIAWFNLSKYWSRRDNDFLQYCRDNKGKNIKFYDEELERELTEQEILALEVENCTPSFEVLREQEINTLYPKEVKSKKRARVVEVARGRPKKSMAVLKNELKAKKAEDLTTLKKKLEKRRKIQVK